MNVKKRSLLDTNVLVYQFDRTNLTKQSTAQNLIKELIRENKVVISSQVVQEFISVALNKFETQIPAQEVQYIIDNLLMPLCAHVPSIDFYKRAVSLFSSNNLNFYDALIIQAAIDLGCDILFSEDLQDGQLFGNLQVINPFK
jgi:predicted nucleic acid-binding protein